MSCEEPTIFSERVHWCLREADLSFDDVLDQVAGMGPINLMKIMSGENEPPRHYLVAMGSIFGCNPDWLSGESEDRTLRRTLPSAYHENWGDFFEWLTIREYLGRKPPWAPQERVSAIVPAWVAALAEALQRQWAEVDPFDGLSDLEIQIIANWIMHRSARRFMLTFGVFAPGPKVVQFDLARARLRPELRAHGDA